MLACTAGLVISLNITRKKGVVVLLGDLAG